MRGMAGALALLKGTKDLERKEDVSDQRTFCKSAYTSSNEASICYSVLPLTLLTCEIAYWEDEG